MGVCRKLASWPVARVWRQDDTMNGYAFRWAVWGVERSETVEYDLAGKLGGAAKLEDQAKSLCLLVFRGVCRIDEKLIEAVT